MGRVYESMLYKCTEMLFIMHLCIISIYYFFKYMIVTQNPKEENNVRCPLGSRGYQHYGKVDGPSRICCFSLWIKMIETHRESPWSKKIEKG